MRVCSTRSCTAKSKSSLRRCLGSLEWWTEQLDDLANDGTPLQRRLCSMLAANDGMLEASRWTFSKCAQQPATASEAGLATPPDLALVGDQEALCTRCQVNLGAETRRGKRFKSRNVAERKRLKCWLKELWYLLRGVGRGGCLVRGCPRHTPELERAGSLQPRQATATP